MATMKTILKFLTSVSLLPATRAIQPGAAPAQPAPLRDLEFGDINILHTTDTHGWHAGHLLEPSFSADWGDYISFSEHLRQRLEAEGKDLLIIDTGDRVEGNGLYDSSSPRGVYTFPIFENQQLDLLCVGNHELYKNSSAEDDYTQLIPFYYPNYIASNLDLVDPETGEHSPFADRYRTFTTNVRGLRILAFGFIFDFDRNDKITYVRPVNDTVNDQWFKDAVADNDVDLIIVIGHVALRSYEFELIHKAIRLQKPDTPIQFFGGHFHVRDYRIFDNKAHALASGRFMETIGFQSISNLSSTPKFSRTYIDNNLYSFYHHSQTNASTFDTELGLETTKAITDARTALNLDQTFGCASQPYWMSRVPFPDDSSVFTLLSNKVFPDFLNLNPQRRNISRLILVNTGAIRFDIFAGPFTRDSTFIVSPFTSNVSFIKDVPYKYAKHLLPILNTGQPAIANLIGTNVFDEEFQISLNNLPPPEQAGRNLRMRTSKHSSDQHDTQPETSSLVVTDCVLATDFYESEAADDDYLNAHIGPRPAQVPFDSDSDTSTSHNQEHHNTKPTCNSPPTALTPGYTTSDDLGTTGDDTIHKPIAYYNVPNTIQTMVMHLSSNEEYLAAKHDADPTLLPDLEDDELVDVVFNQFLAPYITHILNVLPQAMDADVEGKRVEEQGSGRRTYSDADISNYVPGETFTTLLAKWVADNWRGNCKVGEMPDDHDGEL